METARLRDLRGRASGGAYVSEGKLSTRGTLLEAHVHMKASHLCSLPFPPSEPPFQGSPVAPIQLPNSAKIQTHPMEVLKHLFTHPILQI